MIFSAAIKFMPQNFEAIQFILYCLSLKYSPIYNVVRDILYDCINYTIVQVELPCEELTTDPVIRMLCQQFSPQVVSYT